MATYSSIFAWEIPCTEEPGGLQSKRLHRVLRNDWKTECTLIHTHTHTHLSSHVYLFLFLSPSFFFFWCEHLSSYFLVNFNYAIVLSTTITVLYIKSSDLIHLITESLHFYQLLPIPNPKKLQQPQYSTMFLSSIFFSRFQI